MCACLASPFSKDFVEKGLVLERRKPLAQKRKTAVEEQMSLHASLRVFCKGHINLIYVLVVVSNFKSKIDEASCMVWEVLVRFIWSQNMKSTWNCPSRACLDIIQTRVDFGKSSRELLIFPFVWRSGYIYLPPLLPLSTFYLFLRYFTCCLKSQWERMCTGRSCMRSLPPTFYT